MQVTFWGVRGSIPTPGERTTTWGGNSSCVEIRHKDLPPLIFDCGTGARNLGFKLVGDPSRKLHLLFTHFHMDHVFGFPFFIPIYTPGYEVQITVPAYSEDEAREKLSRFLNGVYHPTRLRDLPSRVTFHPIRPGRKFKRDRYEVQGIALNHPGGSVGYRVDVDGQSLAYITDTAPFAKPGEGIMYDQPSPPAERRMVDFLAGCDVVIYDTMYELNEYLDKMTWGHSYPEYAKALCKAAKARHLILFHHNPGDHDGVLDARAEKWVGADNPTVTLAREGDTLNVEG